MSFMKIIPSIPKRFGSPRLHGYKAKHVSTLSRFTPLTLDARGDKILVEEFEESDLGTVSQLLIKASSLGDGFGVNQCTSAEDVKSVIDKSIFCVKLTQLSTSTVSGIYGITPNPLSRSQTPFIRSNFVYLDKAIRGKGLPMIFLREVLPKLDPGRSYLSRTVVTGGGALSLYRAGWRSLGVIPASIEMANVGWSDDLVVCSSVQDFQDDKDMQIQEEDISIPPLQKTAEAARDLNKPFNLKNPLPDLVVGNSTFHVEQANTDDLWQVENMVQEAALAGEGFALDEFTLEGHLNRSLLKENYLMVVKSPNGSIVAAVIFGPSGTCRVYNPKQAAGYIIVEKASRGKGLGSKLLEYCMRNSHVFGYQAILTDVFSCSKIAVGMLLKRGFFITATIPNCGVVAGQGRTHSLLFYRHLS